MEPGAFRIDSQHYSTNLLVLPDSVTPWSVQAIDQIDSEVVEQLLQLQPDLIVLGSGSRQIFPPSGVMSSFARAGMGFEVMDTQAACRTYNVLVSEGRRVLAALLQLD